MSASHHDPFACFGDSSSDDDNQSTDSAAVTNLEKARQMKETSNSPAEPIGMTQIIDDSFEIFDTGPFSGQGVRATVAFKCGDEIMRESAVMRIPTSQSANSLENARIMHKNAIQRAYNSMHPTSQQSVMNLASCDEDDIDVMKTPTGVWDTNSFCLGDDPLGGLFLTISRINHSCRPNVIHFWQPKLKQTLVFATRDIKEGEEIFTTYGPAECMGTESRREYLNNRFSFQCRCDMCLEGNTNGGDEKMMQIKMLQDEIALSAGLISKNGTSSIEKCLALMNEQGIGGGVFTKSLYHQGYEICTAAGDSEGARSYLGRELIAVCHSEGVGSPKAIEIEDMMNYI